MMFQASDRTWPVPKQPWIMRMTWSELAFAHWPVTPDILAPLLPEGLQLDTRDGIAWIGVVPFCMSDVAPRCVPAVPGLSRFLELNVRTYVTCEDKPGVWFFSLDAANRLAVRVARAAFHLPYMDAKMSLSHDSAQCKDYTSVRTHRGEPPARLRVRYHPTGASFRAIPGTLEHWLTARYCLYSSDRHNQLYRGEIDHAPWELSTAQWEEAENSMCSPLGVELVGQPHVLCARPIAVRAWMAKRCG